MAILREIEYWSNYPAAGGYRLGAVLNPGRVIVNPAVDGSDNCEVDAPEEIAAQITRGMVLRIESTTGSLYEFRVSKRKRTLGNRYRTLVGQSPLLELSTSGPIYTVTGATTTFDIGGLYTVAEWIDTFILPHLTARGMTYWARGTVDFTEQVRLEPVQDGRTCLGLLRALQDKIGGEVQAVPVGLTAYNLNFVRAIGSSNLPVYIETGRNLLSLQEDEDDESLATVVIPLGATESNTGLPATIAENAWLISGTVSGANLYVLVKDPAGGVGPIAFTNQFVGKYLLKSDGTTQAIIATAVGTGLENSIEVASLTGFTTDEHVQIVENTSAKRLIEVSNPTATSLIVRTSIDAEQRGERNYLRNPLFLNWTDIHTPSIWTNAGATLAVAKYPRTTTQTFTGIVCNGVTPQFSASVALRGFPANAIIYAGERIWIAGVISGTNGAVTTTTQADGSGVVTLPIAGTTSADTTDGATCNVANTTSGGPLRPAALSFPVERETGDPLRLLTLTNSTTIPPAAGANRLQSEAITVKYVSGPLAQLNASVGFTVHNGNGTDIGNKDSGGAITEDFASMTLRVMPGAMLVDGTPTRLAYAFILQKASAYSTLNAVATMSYTMATDKTVRVCLLSSYDITLFAVARWVALWLGDPSAPTPIAYAQANKLLQAGNRELVARALLTRAISFTFRDLSTVLGYVPSAEQVGLGTQTVFADIGVTARAIGMSINLLEPDKSTVTVDARNPSLIRFLASKL